MKKLIVLLILSAAFFSLGTNAFAQTWPVGSTCSTTIGMLPGYQSGQGTCTYFDFQTGYGYCLAGKSVYSNKAIFTVCNCRSSTDEFFVGSKIGVRMTILVDDRPGENGAYWSLPGDGEVHFGKYDSPESACAGEALESFGPGHFYKYSDRTAPVSIVGDTTCQVPPANQATVLVTDRNAGYEIKDDAYGLTDWFVQIPPIRIDPTILHNNEVIKVKVEFLNQTDGHGICPDCREVCVDTTIVANVGTSSCITCTYTLIPTSSSLGHSGGAGSLAVTTSESGCPWSAISNASWITITSGNTGTGNGTVSYSVSANRTGSSRIGTITIAGKTFTVTQDKNVGLPPLMLLLD
jgi:hypothetical protein